MPKREDEWWLLDKEPQKHGLCPSCRSSNISYNKKYKSWKCNRCEHIFKVPSHGHEIDYSSEKVNKKFKELAVSINNAPPILESKHELKPKEESEENQEFIKINGEEEQTESGFEATPASKAWFGNEYYDARSRKWKKPGRKVGSVTKSLIITFTIIILAIIIILALYVFGLAKIAT
jgi:ribosomal protein L37AE/L43A